MQELRHVRAPAGSLQRKRRSAPLSDLKQQRAYQHLARPLGSLSYKLYSNQYGLDTPAFHALQGMNRGYYHLDPFLDRTPSPSASQSSSWSSFHLPHNDLPQLLGSSSAEEEETSSMHLPHDQEPFLGSYASTSQYSRSVFSPPVSQVIPNEAGSRPLSQITPLSSQTRALPPWALQRQEQEQVQQMLKEVSKGSSSSSSYYSSSFDELVDLKAMLRQEPTAVPGVRDSSEVPHHELLSDESLTPPPKKRYHSPPPRPVARALSQSEESAPKVPPKRQPLVRRRYTPPSTASSSEDLEPSSSDGEWNSQSNIKHAYVRRRPNYRRRDQGSAKTPAKQANIAFAKQVKQQVSPAVNNLRSAQEHTGLDLAAVAIHTPVPPPPPPQQAPEERSSDPFIDDLLKMVPVQFQSLLDIPKELTEAGLKEVLDRASQSLSQKDTNV